MIVSEDSHEGDNNVFVFLIIKEKRWLGYEVEHCNQATSGENKPDKRAEDDERSKHRQSGHCAQPQQEYNNLNRRPHATPLARPLLPNVVRPPSSSFHNYKVPVNRDTSSRSLVSSRCRPANLASFRYAIHHTLPHPCTASRFGHTPSGGPPPPIHDKDNHAPREA